MKIAHFSDLHCRPLKYHVEYRRVFTDFYHKLEENKVDLVVNTGDLVHCKTVLSPELVGLVSEFLTEVSKRAPVLNVLGNHDLNLMNSDRQDAITPIVTALGHNRITLLKKSGEFRSFPALELWNSKLEKLTFWNFGIADVQNWPHPPYPDGKINIGLFHGSIQNCLTDSLFRMTHVEYGTDIFKGLDFAMLGDIHKRQSFDAGHIWYAGSMIQQNFGEDPEKGFLLWDIRSKSDFDVKFIELKGSKKFYTIRLPDDLRVPDLEVESDSRIRVSPPRPLTLVEQKTIERIVKRKFSPHDVITLGAQNVSQLFAQVEGKAHRIENLRDIGVQEQLLREHLVSKKLPAEAVDRIVGLNHKYQLAVEQKEDMARGISWRILKMGWNNLYNFGEGNVIDFSQIRGLTGLFAPNSSGKSSLVDAITVGMFDANTKEVPKNIHLVNDNKDQAVVILELLANGERYTITRTIERLKFGKRKGEEKEWGKTSLDFVRHDGGGVAEHLVGESRPETERAIRRRFGSFEDFMLTALFAQWDPMDLIMCKETDRKRILFRFLDLDIFEEKAKLAKEDAKVWLDRLADLEEGNYEQLCGQLVEEQSQDQMMLVSLGSIIGGQKEAMASLNEEIEALSRHFIVVPPVKWMDAQAIAGMEQSVAQFQKKLLAKQEEARTLHDRRVELGTDERDVGLLDARVRELEQAEAELVESQQALRPHKFHVATRQQKVSLLGQVPCGDSFPTCQFLVDAFASRKELPEHEREVEGIKEKVSSLSARVAELLPCRALRVELLKHAAELSQIEIQTKMSELELENLLLSIGKLEAEIDRARLELAQNEQTKRAAEKNKEIQHAIDQAKQLRAEYERGLEKIERDLASLHRQMGARKTDIDRLEKQVAQIKEVKDTCTAFEHFLGAMGKDGIALQVLTQKLPVINEEINKILSSVVEFGVFIEYDPQDQSIRLYIQYGQYKSRLLELGGGAEKFLASIAIRAALLSISNLPRSNMFIIDEGFGKLDPQNLEAIQRMFDYLRSVFDHVIVISHTDAMKEFVDNMIDIVPDEAGYAHVEIGG